MEFRKASINDLDELVEIRIEMRNDREPKIDQNRYEQFVANTYEYFRRHLDDGSYISWIAKDNDKIVATSGLSFYSVPPTYDNISGNVAYLINMYTHKEYRKRGIATKLLDHLVAESASKECMKITMNASDMGMPLYEKYGFLHTKDEIVFYITL